MINLRKHLELLRKIKKIAHHPLIHKIHKKYKISRKTLFYIKEYGPKSNVPKTIIKESIKILLIASLISSFSGTALENIKNTFISIIPLVILLPALNDMIGDYSIIVSSRLSTLLHEGKIKGKLSENTELKTIFVQIIIIATITTLISCIIAFAISMLSGSEITALFVSKIVLMSLLDVFILITILFFTAIYAGLYFFKKKEDPNNLLIPITTSIADFGNIIILSILIRLFF